MGLKRREEEMDLINATEGKFRLFLHPLYYAQDKYRHINMMGVNKMPLTGALSMSAAL